MENTQNTTQQYIVPVKLLCAIAVDCPEGEINAKVQEKVKQLYASDEARQLLFDVSVKYSELIGGSGFIVVPGLILPIDNKEDADVVIDFVKTLNENVANEQGAAQQNSEEKNNGSDS